MLSARRLGVEMRELLSWRNAVEITGVCFIVNLFAVKMPCVSCWFKRYRRLNAPREEFGKGADFEPRLDGCETVGRTN